MPEETGAAMTAVMLNVLILYIIYRMIELYNNKS